jgi:hypothetical protein
MFMKDFNKGHSVKLHLSLEATFSQVWVWDWQCAIRCTNPDLTREYGLKSKSSRVWSVPRKHIPKPRALHPYGAMGPDQLSSASHSSTNAGLKSTLHFGAVPHALPSLKWSLYEKTNKQNRRRLRIQKPTVAMALSCTGLTALGKLFPLP